MYKPQKNLPFKDVKETVYPVGVQLQTISGCNGRCIMCPYSFVYKKIPHGIMPEYIFKKLIDECTYYDVKEVKPFLMNEPLLDERLPLLLSYARVKLPKTVIGFSTNGMKMEGKMAKGLAEIGLDEVWFNFSGNTASTYNKVMKGLDYHTVVRNIINFADLISKSSQKTSVNISMVEIKDNLEEIDDSINFWKNYGVKVHPIPYNNRGGNSSELNIKVLDKPIGVRVCDKPTTKICILFNGDVVLCPSDWEQRNVIGSVVQDTIYNVWNSEKRLEYIKKIYECKYEDIELCKNCDFPHLYSD